jgi:uncharacterized protein (UPF0212 family)
VLDCGRRANLICLQVKLLSIVASLYSFKIFESKIPEANKKIEKLIKSRKLKKITEKIKL